ncbi:hypothetical protein [Mucilaginibacter lappiensis]|uniref:hypothetical protein n=1 Tax=Mucilaginibacter lappiensis TaxID=354630 RepID=UPI003D2468E0
MPLNEIEQHPFLKYFLEHHNGNVPWEKYTKMIIGSFPVYNITETVYPFNEQRHLIQDESMPFFYGSPTNRFWSSLAEVFGVDDKQLTPIQRKKWAIDLIEDKNILLTDIIFRTNRFDNSASGPYSPNDSALFNRSAQQNVIEQFSLNADMLEWLKLATNISCIYFTAQGTKGKTPGGWFDSLLSNSNIQYEEFHRQDNAVKYRISLNGQVRVIKLFFLPTPSSSRSLAFTKSTRHNMFSNYLESHHQEFYKELRDVDFVMNQFHKDRLKEHRLVFKKLWWYQYLMNNSVYFDGNRYVEV